MSPFYDLLRSMHAASEFLPRPAALRRTHLWRCAIAALLCCACAGVPPTLAQVNSCNVIVQFVPAVKDAADHALLTQLSTQADATIRYEHALGGNQHLLGVSASDARGCSRAVTALQRDTRVILAQLDTRKRAHH